MFQCLDSSQPGEEHSVGFAISGKVMRAAFWWIAFFLAVELAGSSVLAQDYPAATQVLHGTIDNDSLTVQCAPPVGGRMHCSFAQTMVSRPADREDFEGKLPKAIEQALLPEQLKECGDIANFVQAVRDGRTPKGVDAAKYTMGMAAMKSEQKADLLNQLALMDAYCAKPTKETAEAMLRSIHEKDLKTCKIWTNAYTQDFTTQDGGATWISNDGPSGACGVIYISKFERTTGEFSFWTYTTQKVVTKKDGDPILDICSGLDERQIFYNWSGEEKYLDCTYIKFGF